MVDLEGTEAYRPSAEYVEDSNEALTNLTDSTEFLFLKLPFSNDLLSDIDGQKLYLTLHNDGKISMRVSIVNYPDLKALEKLNSTNARHAHRNSFGVSVTTSSRYFPMQSGVASSKGSR
ncbi:hypothetical protein E2542_SST27458 [Spatholobus suberectus]|nr:hypothetical protein E2542_SST30124 [Spatholobus suberectus]TKY50006.1 hypothetical protein E2542_SST27458 [Spatholobus suberectus]